MHLTQGLYLIYFLFKSGLCAFEGYEDYRNPSWNLNSPSLYEWTFNSNTIPWKLAVELTPVVSVLSPTSCWDPKNWLSRKKEKKGSELFPKPIPHKCHLYVFCPNSSSRWTSGSEENEIVMHALCLRIHPDRFSPCEDISYRARLYVKVIFSLLVL